MGVFKGRIFGPGWALQLEGSISYGNPFTVRFQGRGVVGGEQWVYDYLGYFCPPWPAGIDQRPALVGTITRTVPHSSGGGVAPAGSSAPGMRSWTTRAPPPAEPAPAEGLSASRLLGGDAATPSSAAGQAPVPVRHGDRTAA